MFLSESLDGSMLWNCKLWIVVGGDGDDRDRPTNRPDHMGGNTPDWRPPYYG